MNLDHEKAINAKTAQAFMGTWIANLRANFDKFNHPCAPWHVERVFPLRHTQPFDRKDRDIILAAAGPSLDSAIPTLLKHRKSIKIMAVDAALYPLHAAGIYPDWVFNVDPADVAVEFVKGFDTRRYKMFVPITANVKMIDAFKGNLLWYFPFSNDEFGKKLLFHYYKNWMSTIPQRFNVTNTAIMFLHMLNYRRIILVGQDYNYGPAEPGDSKVDLGTRRYCKNAKLDNDLDTLPKLEEAYKDLMKVESYANKNFYWTQPAMMLYAEALNDSSKLYNMQELVNCSCPFLASYPIQDLEGVLGGHNVCG